MTVNESILFRSKPVQYPLYMHENRSGDVDEQSTFTVYVINIP